MPLPASLGHGTMFDNRLVFDDDGNVDSALQVTLTQRYSTNDDERAVLLLVIAGAALSAYLLPLRRKREALVVWFVIGVTLLFGPRALAGLSCAHILLYLTLHPPDRRRRKIYSTVGGVLAALAFASSVQMDAVLVALRLLLGGVCGYLLYFCLIAPLLKHRGRRRYVQEIVVQSAIVCVCVAAVVEGLTASRWQIPLGILLFFWQWERIVFYFLDYKNRDIPRNISLSSYLSVFFSPAMIGGWNIGVTIGQGYSYTERIFYNKDKNSLVMSGLKLWWIALLYLVFGETIRDGLVRVFEYVHIPVYGGSLYALSEAYSAGEPMGSLSVLSTTVLDLIRWILLWGGVVHFKAGAWRLFGYDMEPYFNKPWLATNLVDFWRRFTFHYREFLVRAFYYPSFFRHAGGPTWLRITLATFAAVCIGNMVWGHLTEQMYYQGARWQNFSPFLTSWPYFVLLSLGILVTEIYLLNKKRRRQPWQWNRYFLIDLCSMLLTIQFYALLHIFVIHPEDATLIELTQLFLLAFGIQWA
ncbi:MAG: hypothetical protein R8J84_03890 [Mariprofundales bacterium]